MGNEMRKLGWKLLVGANRLVDRAWRKTGRTSPRDAPELRELGAGEAALWPGAVAGATAAARLLARRLSAGAWRKVDGSPPPA